MLTKVLVYQTNNKNDFIQNMTAVLSKDYVPFSRMECVTCLSFDIEDIPENKLSILEKVFNMCNNNDLRGEIALNYSVSVGDIVVVNFTAYRCVSDDWDLIPLNDAEVKVIKEVYQEYEALYETDNNNEEEKTMMNNNGTINEGTINNNTNGGNDMNNEEKTAAEKAGEFVNAGKDKMVEGAKKFVEDITVLKDTVIKVDGMNNAKAQMFFANKGVEIFNKIKDESAKFLGKLNILSEKTPNPKAKAKLKAKALSLAEFVEILEETLDNENKNGWGKFVEILKAVVKLVLGFLIKGGAIALKLGFIVAVGGIKIGATAIVTAIEIFKLIKNDVVKPAHKATEDAWNVHKKYKDARKTKDNLDNDFDDEFDDEEFYDEFDDMVEEAATVN